MTDPEDVLAFWLGALDEQGRADEEHQKRWWTKDAAFDQEIRDRFSAAHGELMAGGHREWLDTARGRLAAIVVLDQFSRNMFRGTPASFASDPLALELAEEGIARGMDRELRADERQFFYMPLMHSEDVAAQDRCVALFAALPYALQYAEQHRHIVKRFGRFPHRNAILGRESTPDEGEFLKQPESSF